VLELIKKIDSKFDNKFEKYYRRLIENLILEYLLVLKPDYFLEIGCGDSGSSMKDFITSHGIHYIGIDLLRKFNKTSNVHYIISDVDKGLCIKDIPAGCMILVLELLKQPYQFFENLSKAMKPGGRFLITIPNFKSIHYKFYRIIEKLEGKPIPYQNFISFRDVVKAVSLTNFYIMCSGGLLLFPRSLAKLRVMHPIYIFLDRLLNTVEFPLKYFSYFYFILVKKG